MHECSIVGNIFHSSTIPKKDKNVACMNDSALTW